MTLLDVQNVTVNFGGIVALDGLSFAIEQGHICGLIGPNGAGKTTMFNVVSRIYQPTAGSVLYQGKELLHVPAHGIARLGIARTFQNLALFPSMSLLENVMVGAHSQGHVGFLRAISRIGAAAENRRTRDFAGDLLVFPRLSERRAQRAGSLSGGEQQMLAIARALMSHPKLLLCDEPSMGLAPLITQELFHIIERLNREEGLAVLLVEQNANLAMHMASRVYLLETGRIVASGSAEELSADDTIRKAYLGF